MQDAENPNEPSTSNGLGLSEDHEERKIPADQAREHANKVIAALERNRKPGERYDAYVGPPPVLHLHERRNRRRSGLPAIDEGAVSRSDEPPEEEGMRIATLAFFTMMAMMGFLCTYLLVYVVEPMTRKEHEELVRQARAAGYDV